MLKRSSHPFVLMLSKIPSRRIPFPQASSCERYSPLVISLNWSKTSKTYWMGHLTHCKSLCMKWNINSKYTCITYNMLAVNHSWLIMMHTVGCSSFNMVLIYTYWIKSSCLGQLIFFRKGSSHAFVIRCLCVLFFCIPEAQIWGIAKNKWLLHKHPFKISDSYYSSPSYCNDD